MLYKSCDTPRILFKDDYPEKVMKGPANTHLSEVLSAGRTRLRHDSTLSMAASQVELGQENPSRRRV